MNEFSDVGWTTEQLMECALVIENTASEIGRIIEETAERTILAFPDSKNDAMAFFGIALLARCFRISEGVVQDREKFLRACFEDTISQPSLGWVEGDDSVLLSMNTSAVMRAHSNLGCALTAMERVMTKSGHDPVSWAARAVFLILMGNSAALYIRTALGSTAQARPVFESALARCIQADEEMVKA